MGFLSNSNGFEYRFGFLFERGGAFLRLNNLSVEKFEDLLQNKPNISFNAIFGGKEYNIDIKPNKSSTNDLTINGSEGIVYCFK